MPATARVRRAARGGPGQLAHAGDEVQEFARRHFAIGGRAFRQIAQPLLGGDGVADDVMAADADRAVVGGEIARHHLHGGGFARAIGTQKAQHLARPHGQAQARHGSDRPETLGEVLNFDHSRVGTRFFSV